jgi:hypothetical protein
MVVVRLLRDELDSCGDQIVNMEISRESEKSQNQLTSKLTQVSGDLYAVSCEVDRFKSLYGSKSVVESGDECYDTDELDSLQHRGSVADIDSLNPIDNPSINSENSVDSDSFEERTKRAISAFEDACKDDLFNKDGERYKF